MTATQERVVSDDEIDLNKLFGVVAQNWYVFTLACLICLGLGAAYLATTTRLYVASVDIDIGASSDLRVFQDISGVQRARTSQVDIETEIQILRSQRIAERAVRSMNLHESDAFNQQPQTGIGRLQGVVRSAISAVSSTVRGWISETPETVSLPEFDPEAAAIARAVNRLRGNTSIVHFGGSTIIQVRYRSVSPRIAAQVANGVAAAYIEDQLDATTDASQRALDWLNNRMRQLREQHVRLAEIAYDFRVRNNLQGVDIDMLEAAEFMRLTSSLANARANLVELEAQSRQLDQIVATNDVSAVVRETASDQITSRLRSRFLAVSTSYANLVATLGEDHLQTQRRKQELDDLQAMMFDEIRRSAELLRSDVAAARDRIATLEAVQADATERVGIDATIVAQLRELERNAATVQSLYQGFERRYQEARQRQSVPTATGRVLNQARPPEVASLPNNTQVLALSLLVGFLLASLYIGVREWRDDTLRAEEQVREGLGLEYLGALPVIKGANKTVRKLTAQEEDTAGRQVRLPDLLTYCAANPASASAETLRIGRMTIALQRAQATGAARVGFVSCSPGEGKTTVSANFASLLAKQGARVMLIDGDMRNPSLSRLIGRTFETGLLDILAADGDWRDIYHVAEDTGLHILPNSNLRAPHTADLMGSVKMAQLLEELGAIYDYIVMDLPPLGHVVDARAVLDDLDGVFFVAKWGATRPSTVNRVLRMDPRLRQKCYGVFVNLLNQRKAALYGGYQGYRGYQNYYQTT